MFIVNDEKETIFNIWEKSRNLPRQFRPVTNWDTDKYVYIPTTEKEAYQINTKYKWVYTKHQLFESLGESGGPVEIGPPTFPVVIKPMLNLWGEGRNSKIIYNQEEYDFFKQPGQVWQTYYSGKQYYYDLVVRYGEVLWFLKQLFGEDEDRNVNYFYSFETDNLPKKIRDFIANYFSDYKGFMNFEVKTDEKGEEHVIEMTLRNANGAFYMGGENFFPSVWNLYYNDIWDYKKNHSNKEVYIVRVYTKKMPKKINFEKIDELTKNCTVLHETDRSIVRMVPPSTSYNYYSICKLISYSKDVFDIRDRILTECIET